jgi:hypothetical protein
MGRIVLDAELRAKLKNLDEHLEIVDEQGKTVGYLSSVKSTKNAIINGIEVPYTEEEIQSLMKQTSGRPLKDILADLKKLP